MDQKSIDTPRAYLIQVYGKVQGVGFRPFVWQLAEQLKLYGSVCNSGKGVEITCWCTPSQQQQLCQLLQQHCPPLATIERIETRDWSFDTLPQNFTIDSSVNSTMNTQVIPDATSCSACLAEIEDSNNRRWRYPFTNCTHCGPRFTIIRHMPYDRAQTSMAQFVMCPQCQQEYQDPRDRRFHAQPNACPNCGPQVYLTDQTGNKHYQRYDAIEQAATLLLQGKILTIKGLGGFHLACDANNNHSIQQLRMRKHRPSKPLAVMLPNRHWLQRCTNMPSDDLEKLLRSSASPIVLCPKHPNPPLSEHIAPDLDELGVMYPSNPLQHLLLQAVDRPLVMTSGNASGFSPTLDNQHALEQLQGIADFWLLHDREIVQRADDSVVRFSTAPLEVLRRARGFVPDSHLLPDFLQDSPSIFACGGDLKNTFCLVKAGQAIMSPHFGDLQNMSIRQQQATSRQLFSEIWNFTPTAIAVDAHPTYFSHQDGKHLAQHYAVPCIDVLHHHAHALAVLAEHHYPPDQGPVLALALDGLGYGSNGNLWGGELLKVDYRHCQWLGGLPPVALPGGDLAARQPWRNLLAHCLQFIPDWQKQVFARLFPDSSIAPLSQAIVRGLNCPPASSCGRLFDAVAAALGICFHEISWEGEAACRLESLAQQITHEPSESFTIPMKEQWLDLHFFWQHWLALPNQPALRAWIFHDSLARGLAQMVQQQAQQQGINTVVLCGGVIHNRLLRQRLLKALRSYKILLPQKFPAGDGGLALGQAVYAAALLQQT